ncbi:hypothetical protein PR048_007357 [Dryococelus australis]|uniref:Uncharacterized protein n=1 Tax=Dryococelus australis TaxID=614101 RepID=A0ABQ9IDD2_9NEOP|nr:hypothetical protein PR048_007357 [Dryococelus australis]
MPRLNRTIGWQFLYHAQCIMLIYWKFQILHVAYKLLLILCSCRMSSFFSELTISNAYNKLLWKALSQHGDLQSMMHVEYLQHSTKLSFNHSKT